MALIGLGKIDRNLISILVGCFFCFLDRLLKEYVEVSLFENSVLTEIIISISYLFTFIPFIIFKSRTKQVKSTDIETISENKFEYIYIETELNNEEGKGLFILLSATIYFIQSIFYTYTYKIKTNVWILGILITSILYHLIFKQKLYKHHYLSVILIILIGIIIDLVLGNLQNDILENLLFLLIRLFRDILKSLNVIVDKYIMEKKNVQYMKYPFFGLFDIMYLIIFSILDYYFFEYFGVKDFGKYFNNFKSKELLGIFGIMLTQLGIYISILYTNKNYITCHIFIIYVFGQIVYYLNFSVASIIVFICLIFILFFSLVFNEIIEINFWGLSDNTKKNIRNRGENEVTDNFLVATKDTFCENDEKEEEIIELNDNIEI